MQLSCRPSTHNYLPSLAWSLRAPPARSGYRRVCLTDRQGPDCTVAVILVNRIVSLTSQTTATTCFSSGRSRHRRHCQRRCVVCRRWEERDGRKCKSCMTDRHGPTVPWEYFLVPRFFLCLHRLPKRPVFLQLARTIDRYVLLHTLACIA